jgi:hypothetical protein
MKTPTKLVVLAVAVCGVVLLIRHAETESLAIPKDMPANSKFLQSGFNIANDEAQGTWVACRLEAGEGTDWCRVTDQKGIVLFQGSFLPLNSTQPLGDGELAVAAVNPTKIWVKGPVEGLPVPAIPLANGSMLVPAGDRYALIQRWNADPSEYDAVRNSAQ